MNHEPLMREALKLARTAIDIGEVPIAAVIALDGKVIGWGWNELVAKRDPTMHAEIAAFRDAAGRFPVDAKNLVLVSTLEPCVMCYGAALLSGVSEIAFAVAAPADSGIERVSCPDSPDAQKPSSTGGVLAAEAMELFQYWLDHHPEQDAQRAYIEQLLKLNHAL